MKKKNNSNHDDSCMCCHSAPWSCCMSYMGIVHVGAGVGLGFLIVQYTGMANLGLWGWVLLGVAAVGHFVGSMKCTHC